MKEGTEALCAFLPDRLAGTVAFYQRSLPAKIEEIRLYRGAPVWLSAEGRVIRTEVVVTDHEFDQTLDALCDHSLYSQLPTMIQGYLVQKNGLRIGVSGKAVTEAGRITTLSRVNSLHLRTVSDPPNVAKELYEHLREVDFSESILLFAPPAVGKTTLLRDLILRMANGTPPRRLAVVDPRSEFATPRLQKAPIDLLQGYPMGAGIEIAVRTLSPDCIVCDEIGSEADTAAILSNLHAGVPIVATAHGSVLKELLMRPTMQRLHAAHAFDCYGRLTREGITYTKREEALC